MLLRWLALFLCAHLLFPMYRALWPVLCTPQSRSRLVTLRPPCWLLNDMVPMYSYLLPSLALMILHLH
ncbi:hypothetical protein C8Q73DRAFT_679397 [Cubamyces lactineus]|nr:hypothetical protein C8Q73DRAFT_679397 [Cubamyces lactineus]